MAPSHDIHVDYTNFLSESERAEYTKLVSKLQQPENKFKKYKRLESIDYSLERIKEFVNSGTPNDWARALSCGAFWIDDVIGINTSQLRKVLKKCKSSINGALSIMGYEPVALKNEGIEILHKYIPATKDNYNEQRKWSIRKRNSLTPVVTYESKTKTNVRAFLTPKVPVIFDFSSAELMELPAIFNDVPVKTENLTADESDVFNTVDDPCLCLDADWFEETFTFM